MATTYQGSWTVAVAQGVVVGLAVTAVVLAADLLLDAVLPGAGLGVVASLAVGAALGLFTAFQVRRRSLTLQPGGLLVLRDGVRIQLEWRDFEGVRQSGPFKREELVFSAGEVEPLRATARMVERMRKTGADRTVAIGDFVGDWKRTEVFAAARRTGKV